MSEKITICDGKLQIPDQPVVCYIEGDGTGPDIWAAAQKVLDAGVKKGILWKTMHRMAGDLSGRKRHTD